MTAPDLCSYGTGCSSGITSASFQGTIHFAAAHHVLGNAMVRNAVNHGRLVKRRAAVHKTREAENLAAPPADQAEPAAHGGGPRTHFPVLTALEDMVDPGIGYDNSAGYAHSSLFLRCTQPNA